MAAPPCVFAPIGVGTELWVAEMLPLEFTKDLIQPPVANLAAAAVQFGREHLKKHCALVWLQRPRELHNLIKLLVS
jgi:hypothetical protein